MCRACFDMLELWRVCNPVKPTGLTSWMWSLPLSSEIGGPVHICYDIQNRIINDTIYMTHSEPNRSRIPWSWDY